MVNRHPTTNVSEAEIESCFKYWYEHDRNYKATARQFKRARTTIYRHAKKRNWDQRATQIRQNIAKGTDQRIEQEQIANVKLAGKCLKKEVDAYLDPEREATGDIRAIIALMKYLDEAGKPNEIAEALKAARQDELPFDPDLAAEVLVLLGEALAEQKEHLGGQEG